MVQGGFLVSSCFPFVVVFALSIFLLVRMLLINHTKPRVFRGKLPLLAKNTGILGVSQPNGPIAASGIP